MFTRLNLKMYVYYIVILLDVVTDLYATAISTFIIEFGKKNAIATHNLDPTKK